MGLFGKGKSGGLMNVIRCDEAEYLVWKWRPEGQAANSTTRENSIRFGSSLRVKEGEVAAFVYKQGNGQVMDYIVGPYDGAIKTDNFPILAGIIGTAFGGESPFQAEIYFINLQSNNQIKFAIPYFDIADPRSLDITVPFAVRGSITFNLTDYKNFIKLNRLVDFNLEAFSNQIKGAVTKYVKSFVSNCPVEMQLPVLQLERKVVEISDMVKSRLAPIFEEDFGVNLKRFDISAIEPDKESEGYLEFSRLTKEQQLRRAEIDTENYERQTRLSTESQFIQAHAIDVQADVMKAAAQNMGGSMDMGGGMNPAGMMMGMAVGGAMGQTMAGMMGGMGQAAQMGGQPVSAPPVPPTVTFMIANNGQQSGPYTIPQIQQFIAAGQITKQTYVWKQGMANWAFAETVPELAGLFAPTPPPIPPTPPAMP